MKEFGLTKNTLKLTRAIRLETPCVLIVDDEPANRLLVGKLLEKLGCTSIAVSSADEAVGLVKGQAFDLILMDCSMPGKSGYDATREIREHEGDGLQTPVIAFTASHESEVLREYLRAGMTGYLSKPIEMPALVKLIDALRG